MKSYISKDIKNLFLSFTIIILYNYTAESSGYTGRRWNVTSRTGLASGLIPINLEGIKSTTKHNVSAPTTDPLAALKVRLATKNAVATAGVSSPIVQNSAQDIANNSVASTTQIVFASGPVSSSQIGVDTSIVPGELNISSVKTSSKEYFSFIPTRRSKTLARKVIIGIHRTLANNTFPDNQDIVEEKHTSHDLSLGFNLVKDPSKVLPIARLGTDNGVNFEEYYNPSHLDSSNDNDVSSLSGIQKSHLYLAIVQKVDNTAPDIAEHVVSTPPPEQTRNEIEIYDELMQIATDTTNSRVSELVTSGAMINFGTMFLEEKVNPPQDNYSVIAAGDTNRLKGTWIRGIYGYIKQGKRYDQPGFYGKTNGGTIGVDSDITDNTLIGISYTRMHANFKHKFGVRNTISDVVSLYGTSNLSNNFILHGLFSVGKIRSKQKTQRLVDIGKYKTANAKFNVNKYNLETILNYKVPTNNNNYIIPNVGFRFGKNYNSNYSEYGTGVYNLSVSLKQHTSLVAIIGIKTGKAFTITDNLTLTRGIHAEIDYYIHNKTGQAKAKMQWSDTFSNTTTLYVKTDKTGYNLGSTLLIGYKRAEILATYNAHLIGKHISHQGSLKLRLLF